MSRGSLFLIGAGLSILAFIALDGTVKANEYRVFLTSKRTEAVADSSAKTVMPKWVAMARRSV